MKRKMKLVSLALAIFALSFPLVGCGKGSSAKSSGNQTLVFTEGAEPVGLDPALVSDGEAANVLANVCEGLVRFKLGTTTVEPCLATSWKVSSDGTEYTFNLRKNVKFHDGTPFNADAAVFNLERQLPPNVKPNMPYANFIYGYVDSVKKVDDSTISIKLKKPFTPFLKDLALICGAVFVSPDSYKKANGNVMENPVGTGPFKFVSWQKSQSITVERNNDYWGTKAKLSKVVFNFVSESSTRTSNLVTGASDIIESVDPNDISKINQSGLNVLKQNGLNDNYLAFNCTRAPFNDVKVRQAVNYAINKDELVKYLYQGYASTAKSFMPSTVPGYDTKLQQYNYDPEKAKELLKEAGKENLSVKMITYSNPRPYNLVGGQKLAEAIQGYLSKVGIKATIEASPWKEYVTKAQSGQGDMEFFGWIGVNGDPDVFMSLFGKDEIKSKLNISGYSTDATDALILKGRELSDGKERNEVYSQLQELVQKDAPWVSISNATDIEASSKKVVNYKLQPTGLIFLREVEKK